MQAIDGAEELNLRIAALDTANISDYDTTAFHSLHQKTVAGDAEKFISVLRHITSKGRHDETPVTSSSEADAVIGTCRLISRLGTLQPVLVSGGITGLPQYWISTIKPPRLPPREQAPSQDHFISPAMVPPASSANPFGMGFYTSTGFGASQGMWRIYLDFDQDSSLFRKPWHVWRLGMGAANIYEVTNATDWEELALRYPMFSGGLIYPDWKSIAEDWDAVHITLRAIAAIQGIRLRASRGLIAPSYWDVESTFWLHWVFSSLAHVETVEGSPESPLS